LKHDSAKEQGKGQVGGCGGQSAGGATAAAAAARPAADRDGQDLGAPHADADS